MCAIYTWCSRNHAPGHTEMRGLLGPRATRHSQAGHLSNTRQLHLHIGVHLPPVFQWLHPLVTYSRRPFHSPQPSFGLCSPSFPIPRRLVDFYRSSCNAFPPPFLLSFARGFIYMFRFGRITRFQGDAALRRYLCPQPDADSLQRLAPASRSIFEMSSVSSIPGLSPDPTIELRIRLNTVAFHPRVPSVIAFALTGRHSHN
jgi:hypothetical protein